MIQSVCCLSSTAPPQDSCSLDGMRYGYKAHLPWILPGEVRFFSGFTTDVQWMFLSSCHLTFVCQIVIDCFQSFVNVETGIASYHQGFGAKDR